MQKEMEAATSGKNKIAGAYAELERGVYTALETYSNVHRGSGHNSMVTTYLFEQARDIVLAYTGLNKKKYVVIFCSPRIASILKAQVKPNSCQILSSEDIGLSLGLRALIVEKKALPKGVPFQTGGGTAKLMSQEWVIWADAPGKFEAGTPSIINIIAFAKALLLIQQFGKDIFTHSTTEIPSAIELLHNDELAKYSGQELLDKLRNTLIGHGACVPTMEGSKPFINLDNSASTPTFVLIWNVYRQLWHQPQQTQQKIIQEVKSVTAKFLGAPLATYDIIFTSNTTEAINLAAESLSRENEEGIEPVILNTLLEHSSNDLPWRINPRFSLSRLQIDTDGFVDLNELETLLRSYNQDGQYGNKQIKIVAICGASNVLGVCNNIYEISQIVHRFGARLLVDAAQLIAHRKIDIEQCGIDYLAFSAHKVYAPFGCGVLVVKKGLLNFTSEEIEFIHLSGEENAGGIAALGKALILLQRIGMDLIIREEQALTERALRGMAQINGLKIFGIKDPESPKFVHKIGVIVFNMKSIMPNRLANELAARSGIGVRYGCHCAHIIIKHLLNVKPFLEQFQRLIQTLFPKLRLPGLVRISLGLENSEQDVDTFIQVLSKIARQEKPSTDSEVFNHNEKYMIPQTDVKKQMKDFAKASAHKVYSKI